MSQALSNSPSKTCYGFSKGARFPKIGPHLTAKVNSSAYDKPSDFTGKKGFNSSVNGFGSNSTRFQYYNTSERHGKLPSSNSYDT